MPKAENCGNSSKQTSGINYSTPQKSPGTQERDKSISFERSNKILYSKEHQECISRVKLRPEPKSSAVSVVYKLEHKYAVLLGPACTNQHRLEYYLQIKSSGAHVTSYVVIDLAALSCSSSCRHRPFPQVRKCRDLRGVWLGLHHLQMVIMLKYLKRTCYGFEPCLVLF